MYPIRLVYECTHEVSINEPSNCPNCEYTSADTEGAGLIPVRGFCPVCVEKLGEDTAGLEHHPQNQELSGSAG